MAATTLRSWNVMLRELLVSSNRRLGPCILDCRLNRYVRARTRSPRMRLEELHMQIGISNYLGSGAEAST